MAAREKPTHLHTKNLTPASLLASTMFVPCTSSGTGVKGTVTPNTHSAPSTARRTASLSPVSASTTSQPRAVSACAAGELASRVTARGVKVPSARRAVMTDPPGRVV